MSKTFVIYGVSKGLGQAMLEALPHPEDRVYGISRSQPHSSQTHLHWIAADLSKPEQARDQVKAVIGTEKVDYLIYNVGIWESLAFDPAYDFQQCSDSEIATMLNTNIHASILAIQSLLDNLKQSENAKIILIGSTWGLDNHNGKEVVFSASKYALRGMIHALRENLRADRIAVTILNLGYLATEFGLDTPVEQVLEQSNAELIPLQDVMLALKFILATSDASCIKEINMPAMADHNV